MVAILSMWHGMGGCTSALDPGIHSVAEVEAFIDAPLPPTAQNVQVHAGGFIDVFVMLRAELPPEDARAYVDGIGISLTPGERPLGVESPPADLSWWAVGEAQTFSGGTLSRFDVNLYYAVMLDQTAAEVWVVYLMAYQT